jgi:nitrous-oxide reductase
MLGLAACEGVKPDAPGTKPMATGDVQAAALASYVKPGDQDQYYLFYSGGHSGQVFVAGVPSMRHIFTIPVFTPSPGTGYGYDEESKAMLGGFTWGDVHHPAASKTACDYDGRWLFVNDNANNRIARIDLRDLKTKQILGPIPNTMGNHGSSMLTDNTEYALVATRFSVPIGNQYVPIEDYARSYKGAISGIKIDPGTGTMSLGWQIMTPPFNWDLGATGKGPSNDWAFWTSYNSERATGKLETTASQNDRDYIAVVNWKAAERTAAAGGEGTSMVGGVRVIDPAKVPGMMHLLPCGKSPHGVDVDPSGEYVVCTFTKPAGSPFGDTSSVPSAEVEATKTNGAAAMNRRLWPSITRTTLSRARWCASPVTARTAASLVTTSPKRARRSLKSPSTARPPSFSLPAPRIVPRNAEATPGGRP